MTHTTRRLRARTVALSAAVAASALAGGIVAGVPAQAASACGFTVNDTILAHARSVLGTNCPQMNTMVTPNGKGIFVHFSGGASVYWKNTQPGAKPQLVLGEIRNKWASSGWENGPLGFPTTDETSTPDKAGRFNHFEGGSVYWKANLGPQLIRGSIRESWAGQGWERGQLGYPISDEQSAVLFAANRFSDFENGLLNWNAKTGVAKPLTPILTMPGTDVLAQVKGIVEPLLANADKRVKVRGALTFAAAPKDYARDGAGLHNRLLQVKIPLAVDIKVVQNPKIDLVLDLEINRNADGSSAIAVVRGRRVDVDVKGILNLGNIGKGSVEGDIRKIVEAAVNPQIGKQHPVSPPELAKLGIKLLSVKVMKDNSVQVFVG